jgi:flagellar hook assembly protein FlgD
MKMTSTSTKKMLLLKWVGVILLSCITIGQAIAQNVFSGEPVQWVGQPNGYNTNPYNSDYRTTVYRKISTTVSNPADGRGQWATTVNVQNTGGDVTPFNMPGGGGAGWLMISGPSSGRFNNKWNFNGIGQAAVNSINNIIRQGGGNDMGLNMSTTGRYTFVMRDAGYANSEVYIAYTSNAPVSVSRTGQSFNPSGFTSDISISTSASPSSGENVYVRYRSGTNDFTTGTSIVQATGSGTNWTAAIPQQTCGATVYYYVFTSTRTLGQLNGNSEQERSLSAIRYDDNTGNNYNYTVSPVPIAGITNNSGSTVLTCALSSISVTATGGQAYSWDGGLGNIAAASITAPGTYTVTVTGANGCTATSSITITQDNTAPTAGITNNSGSTVLTCALSSISVTATGGQAYSWDGGLGNSAAASITAPGTYTVTVTGANGCSATSSISVTQNLNLPAAPVVSGITNVCPFVGTGTPITYTAISANATGFTWVVPGNVNIISGQGTASLTVTFAPGFTAQANKQLRVTATNTCGSSTQVIYYLLAQLPNTPSTIVASTNNVCPSIGTLVSITYTIPKVAAATSYLWTAQAGTTTITHTNGLGVNDTTVTVLFSGAFTTSAITVRAVNDCGTSSARSLTISRNNPSTPSLISGPTMACPYISPNGTPASYSIPAVPNATSYNWTVPSGAIGLSGQGTNSISFVYPPGFTSGTISVTASNGCGNSASRNLSISTLSPATPGVIDVVNTATCPNRQYTYTIAALPSNATTLTWTVAGGNILSGQGTTSITVSYASTAINGSISVVAGNNCGNSVVRTLNVKLPACTQGRSIENASNKGFVPLTETFTINVFPNPSTSAFRVQVETGSQELVKARVLDLQGRVLQQLIVVPGKTVELGTNLKSGQYILETTQGNIIKSTRMVKL